MARSNRTFPQLVNIKDPATHESLRQNWQKTHDHDDSLASLTARIATLESQVSTLQSQVASLQDDVADALTRAGESA
jgi:chaperonin cofactor prefoldin